MVLLKFRTVLACGAMMMSSVVFSMPVMHTVEFPQDKKQEMSVQKEKAEAAEKFAALNAQ
ncbi:MULTISPECIES: hypothetical protein [Acinetobacter]|jgi:hypothetical protein|uniref:Uncharacterized protein n=1 Tax=Acinetobacter entericus TaxID=2989714 RepID=A0ABT3NFT5_9GAMM|nr:MULTISPECIES: hypothetical protein [Acinetobacter]MCW8038144.1 hypothetical protein [Acinetobacter entericus]TCB75189.1 hypothetical protein E0H91_05975 [Acinetobacter sp. ANC 4177]